MKKLYYDISPEAIDLRGMHKLIIRIEGKKQMDFLGSKDSCVALTNVFIFDPCFDVTGLDKTEIITKKFPE